MQFGWINIFGAAIVIIMLIPNIIYALKIPMAQPKGVNRAMSIIEQIGRYCCMALMVVPLGVGKFGFSSAAGLICYILSAGGLLLSYLIIWAFYFKKQTKPKALALAILPAVLFLTCSLLLGHWLLTLSSLVFAAGHIYITVKSF